MYYSHNLHFFFFQAEDGIRDLTVTGVQTCALPISYERACGVVVAGLQSCRRTGLLRHLARCGCLSGVHAVNAASSAANPATATTQVAPERSAGVAGIWARFFADFLAARQESRSAAGPKPGLCPQAGHASKADQGSIKEASKKTPKNTHPDTPLSSISHTPPCFPQSHPEPSVLNSRLFQEKSVISNLKQTQTPFD